MSKKAILFDLDGTLLPMDQDAFIKAYFRELAAKMAPLGFEPQTFIRAMWTGIEAMMKNNGVETNETVFFKTFSAACDNYVVAHLDAFKEFYRNEFERARVHCGVNPAVPQLLNDLKTAGHRIVLATSPVYPRIAVEARVRWAGINMSDFELVTTYENSNFCKPNPAYYKDIADRLHLLPEECVMIGNDTTDDLPAAEVGMQVFILTDNLINKAQKDISTYPHGDFNAMKIFLRKL